MKQIAYLTDAHIDESFPKSLGADARANWSKVLSDVKERQIDEIVFGGDMGEPVTNQWFLESMADFRLSVTLGNHDEFEEVTKHFRHDAFNSGDELFYAFDDGGFRRIYLDSSSEKISYNQFVWLKVQLKTQLPILLFIHHAIFPVDSAIDRKHYLRGRERLQQLLIESGKQIFIFCGHYHLSDEQQIASISQFISSAVSYQVLKDEDPIQVSASFFGYRIIRINDQSIETETIRFEVSG